MLSPRRCFAESSPMTQRTASMTFDLPQPFGPTTPVRLLGKLTWVGSTKDLKPASLILVSRISYIALRVCRRILCFGRTSWVAWTRSSLAASAARIIANAHLTTDCTGDFFQPQRARLHDPHPDSGVHLPVPEDRAARLRDARAGIRAGPAVRGAEGAEAV